MVCIDFVVASPFGSMCVLSETMSKFSFSIIKPTEPQAETDLEDGDEPELHVERSGVAPDHVGDLGAHVDGEGLGAGGEARGREDGRVHLHVVVRVQRVAYVVVHLGK